ncbi:hypothetical protein [Rhodoferax mekongensis]|uniref:Uncharacterized protein n=1 Tax=Rhodoferax mekongensis TaxID=3068341 RepID=A0ABZ0AZ08_9BURK|nr:hypothetical protein [Rhodoferax sp. TBRC 17307]WNO03979.1 hypothetical protein RAN89_13810 [Rhodoferax sp. TBRC 17307]
MVKVAITNALRGQMQAWGLDPAELIEDFTTWKSGPEDDHFTFGSNALGRGSKLLHHVHMVPLFVPEAYDQWLVNWENYRPRTSDRYLFYVDGGLAYGYLLIAIINDPGAHAVWQPQYAQYRKDLESIADDFFHFGIIP